MAGPQGTAVFRADASARIGGGHVLRSLALADALAARGWRCVFASRAPTLETVPALACSGHRVITLSASDEPRAIAKALPGPADWLIVDHYALDATFHADCRRWAARILVIDDLADRRHDCDVLLDATPGRRAGSYLDRVPPAARVLLGPAYALLRPGFAGERERRLAAGPRGCCARVFVGFGMTDPGGYTAAALQGMARAGLDLPVDVALGRAAPGREAVSALAGRSPFPVAIHEAPGDMPAVMARADVAVGAAGVSAWERCCLGLPALVAVAADNQAEGAAALARAGAAIVLEPGGDALDGDAVARALRELCADGERLHAMSRAAAAMCDGRGTERVCRIMVR